MENLFEEFVLLTMCVLWLCLTRFVAVFNYNVAMGHSSLKHGFFAKYKYLARKRFLYSVD